MASYLSCAVLLMAFFVDCQARFRPLGDIKVNGVVSKEEVVDDDGTAVFVTKTSDNDCLYEQDTTRFPDKSISAVVKDFANGKSALMFSTSPDVCYIRDIPQVEQFHRARGCKNGLKSGSLPNVWRNYVEGEELSADDLPPLLADVCEGRRIISLVEAGSGQNNTKPARALTERSKCQTQTCRPVNINCRDVCVRYGWWFRENECWDRERRCDTSEECKTVTTC